MTNSATDDPWQALRPRAGQMIGRFICPRHACYAHETYRDFDLWIGLGGHGAVELGARQLELRGGSLLLVPPGVPIELRTDDRKPLEMAYAHFDLLLHGQRVADAAAFTDAAKLTLSLPGVPPIALLTQMDTVPLADTLLSARMRLHDDIVRLQLEIELWQIIRRLRLTHARPGEATTPGSTPLEHALTFIQNRLDQRLTLEMVAEHVGVSVPTLGRLFRQHLRTSPGKHLLQLRLARARDLLRSADLNISEVAAACGFQSLAFFSRTFRGEHGASPRDFRRRHQALP